MKSQLLILFTFISVVCTAQSFVDKTNHYKIDYTPSWEQLAKEKIKAHLDSFQAAKGVQTNVSYDAGFFLKERGPFIYPYVLWYYKPIEGVGNSSISEIAKEMAKAFNAEKVTELKDKIGVTMFNLKTLMVDSIHNYLTYAIESDMPSTNLKGRTLISIHPAKNGVLYCYFYSTSDEYQKFESEFKYMIRSVQFEEPYKYKFEPVKKKDSASATLGKAIAAGLVFGVYFYFKNKNKKKQEPLS